MADRVSHDVRAEFSIKGVDEPLWVVGFEGQEGISRLFEFRVTVAARALGLDMERALDRAARLTVSGRHGPQHVCGVISQLELLRRGRRRTLYLATLVPRAWRLTLGQDCRVFQEQSTAQIVATLLREARVEHRLRLRGERAARVHAYRVQYLESDWRFISRLLQEEGISYYFEHTADGHLLQLVDHADLLPALEHPGERVELRGPGPRPAHEHVFDLSLTRRVVASGVALDDHDYRRPALDLAAWRPGDEAPAGEAPASPAEGPSPGGGCPDKGWTGRGATERQRYPGGYRLPREGRQLAQAELEALQGARLRGRGRGDVLRFRAGQRFTLHRCGLLGRERQELVLTSVRHRGIRRHPDLQDGAPDPRLDYENGFGCLPGGAPCGRGCPPRPAPGRRECRPPGWSASMVRRSTPTSWAG